MDAKEQIKNWSLLYGKPVSDEEYKEICHNLDGLFTTLKEWDDAERMLNERNDNNRSEYIPRQT